MDGETGFLVPRGDVGALTTRLGRLCGDPGLRARLGEGGRASYVAGFGLEGMSRDTLALYLEAIGAGNGRGLIRGPQCVVVAVCRLG